MILVYLIFSRLCAYSYIYMFVSVYVASA